MPIHELSNIRDVLKYVTPKSIVLFDLDNTAVESKQAYGSYQWFVHYLQQAMELMPKPETEALVIAIYHEVMKKIQMAAVEEETLKTIQALQQQGIPALALTARMDEIKDITLQQLRGIGISWTTSLLPKNKFYFSINSQDKAFYQDGIIFCNAHNKGQSLQAFLNMVDKKFVHVVMLDDKKKHLEAAQEIFSTMDIIFDGFRYGFADKKVVAYNQDKKEHEKAEQQLLTHSLFFPAKLQQAVKTFHELKNKSSSTALAENKLTYNKWY